jgi:hypothetical protein
LEHLSLKVAVPFTISDPGQSKARLRVKLL